jgi:PAS domain S-box-containing protein
MTFRHGDYGQPAGRISHEAPADPTTPQRESAPNPDAIERCVQERTADLAQANQKLTEALHGLKKTEERLRDQEAQLAAIINSTTDAIITLDAEYRVMLFNRAAEQVFGVSAAQAIGQPGEGFLAAGCRPALRHLSRSGSTAAPCGCGPLYGLRADGVEFPIEAAASRVQVGGNTLYTINLRDITERRQSEETLKKLSRAVEQSAESVVITDCTGLIQYVNPAFERQTGYAREEALGRTPALLKSGEHDKEFYEALWSAIESGQAFRGVFTNRKKNGELYHDLQTITPLRDDQGKISHYVACGRDITHRKRTEEALLRINAQLEREATRIAHALHDEAGQFLTSAHIVLADVARDLPPAAQQRLKEVREHLNQIEEQLRNLSRELRPRILEDLGLPAALEFLAKGVAQRTGVHVTMEVAVAERLPSIMETSLYRLVQEALTNASRHAHATLITVRLAREAGSARCEIRDNGVGFNVPEWFGRPGSSSLGLVGIRDRLEALGGSLHIDSVPGRGTTLLVVIPLE